MTCVNRWNCRSRKDLINRRFTLRFGMMTSFSVRVAIEMKFVLIYDDGLCSGSHQSILVRHRRRICRICFLCLFNSTEAKERKTKGQKFIFFADRRCLFYTPMSFMKQRTRKKERNKQVLVFTSFLSSIVPLDVGVTGQLDVVLVRLVTLVDSPEWLSSVRVDDCSDGWDDVRWEVDWLVIESNAGVMSVGRGIVWLRVTLFRRRDFGLDDEEQSRGFKNRPEWLTGSLNKKIKLQMSDENNELNLKFLVKNNWSKGR